MTKKEYDIQIALGSLSLQDRAELAGNPLTDKNILETIHSEDVNVYVRIQAGFSLFQNTIHKLEQKVQS